MSSKQNESVYKSFGGYHGFLHSYGLKVGDVDDQLEGEEIANAMREYDAEQASESDGTPKSNGGAKSRGSAKSSGSAKPSDSAKSSGGAKSRGSAKSSDGTKSSSRRK